MMLNNLQEGKSQLAEAQKELSNAGSDAVKSAEAQVRLYRNNIDFTFSPPFCCHFLQIKIEVLESLIRAAETGN